MAMAVITVASGGMPVTDVTATAPLRGMPVTEAITIGTVKYGRAVTKVANGIPVTFVVGDLGGSEAFAPFATWDSSQANVTMSNGNLTATRTTVSAYTGARSTTNKTTGKYYFEFTGGGNPSTQGQVGLIKSTSVYGDTGGGSNGCFWFVSFGPGYIYSNNGAATVNTTLATTPSDRICCAIDLDARLVWFRKNGGIWNNNGAANPATGVGGLAVQASIALAPFCYFDVAAGTTSDTCTVNFGATSFSYTAPSGFGPWKAS